MNNENYILNTGSETEYRLNILEKIYGEYTNKLFQEINFKKGMKVAVIGCGSGSGVDKIYEKIGEVGRILCLDISPKQIALTKSILDNKGIYNVDYLVYDIEKYNFKNNYDVVYCRFVLIHLKNPNLALKNMLNLIKENGVIACEEHNYKDIFCYPNYNSIEKFKSLLRDISKLLCLDYAYGEKLFYEMVALGLDISYIKKFTPLCTSNQNKNLIPLSLIEAREHYIKHNIVNSDELDKMTKEMQIIANKKEILQSPGSVFQCIGKKQ